MDTVGPRDTAWFLNQNLKEVTDNFLTEMYKREVLKGNTHMNISHV